MTDTFTLPSNTRIRSQSGPAHLAPVAKSKSSYKYATILNASNMHQITVISPDMKYKRELTKTKSALSQLQKDYNDLMDMHEAEKLFADTRETILKDKNTYLTNLVMEYREKYQQIEAKNKYIDCDRDSIELEIPVLEMDISHSNEIINELQQSLQVMNDTLLRKDNKMKSLSEQLINSQTMNKEWSIKCAELENILNTEIEQSQRAMELQIAELTEHNLALSKEKTDLQEILERKEESAYAINEQFKRHRFQSISMISPKGICLDALHMHACDSTEPVFVRLPSNPYRSHIINGSVLETCVIRKKDDEMHTIVEENDITHTGLLPFSASQDIFVNDNEENMIEELIQNDEFMNTEAVKYLCKDNNPMTHYLHLTASAMKIKYCDSKIKTEDLIRRVKHCSFYQYHDQMARILEMEKKANNFENDATLTTTQQLVQQKRYIRKNNSIAYLENIASVTRNIQQWERSGTVNVTKCTKRKSKKYKKKDIYDYTQTMIYKAEDLENAKQIYSSQ